MINWLKNCIRDKDKQTSINQSKKEAEEQALQLRLYIANEKEKKLVRDTLLAIHKKYTFSVILDDCKLTADNGKMTLEKIL